MFFSLLEKAWNQGNYQLSLYKNKTQIVDKATLASYSLSHAWGISSRSHALWKSRQSCQQGEIFAALSKTKDTHSC